MMKYFKFDKQLTEEQKLYNSVLPLRFFLFKYSYKTYVVLYVGKII